MKRLYNDYLACNYFRDPLLKRFNDLVNDCSRNIVAFAKENDLDYRDACSWAQDTIQCDFAEVIIRRALQMRRDEKAEKNK
jgi:hypothetical protein